MPALTRLLLITFLESLATTLIERSVYFYSHERLGFTDAENLLLALGFGTAYVVGALASHPLSKRVSEKRLLVLAMGGQLAGHLVLSAWPGSHTLAVFNAVLGLFNGLKWPLIESFVNAGQTPSAVARRVGRFNLSWVVACPLGLAVAGPIIGAWPRGIFLLAAMLGLASLGLLRPLAGRPAHLPDDHPERPGQEALARYRGLLVSSRWTMLSSYALMWVLVALVPGIFARLGFGVTVAPAMSGLLDVVRALAFLSLQRYAGWHNRAWPLALAAVGIPVGFFLTLFGPDLATVLAGEVVFGASAGMTYYAALYYAMVVKNAAVDAGGAHEGLIGSGFTIGPALGLLGVVLAPVLGTPVGGMMVGVAPLVAICAAGAVRSLVVARRMPRQPQA